MQGGETWFENLPKFCGDKIFLQLVKIIWGEKYLLLHFHYFVYLETVTTRKSKLFLLWISQEMWMHQELLFADIPKFIKNVI